MIYIKDLDVGDVVTDSFGIEWYYVGGCEFRRDEGVSKIVDRDILINWNLKEIKKLEEVKAARWNDTENIMTHIGSGYNEIAYKLKSGETIKLSVEVCGDSVMLGIAQEVKCCPTCNKEL